MGSTYILRMFLDVSARYLLEYSGIFREAVLS